jgi:hypothetical protein
MTVRRMKTYTGEQGYVYQYYFVGKRPAAQDSFEKNATEFVFDVTSDRKAMFAVSVFLPDRVVEEWNKNHGRALTEAEMYGAVKMRLFRAFDEIEDMRSQGRQLHLDTPALAQLLAALGVD